jgi:hypothetical protein
MNIKISYKKPEDIMFSATNRVWDQWGKGSPKEITANTELYLWPSMEIQKNYDADFLDVLVAPVLSFVTKLTEAERLDWPSNQLVDPSDADGKAGHVRYKLGIPRRYPLSEAKVRFPDVAATTGNSTGVYVK